LEEAKNKYIYICTATTTQSELLSALERTTEQTWEVNRLDGEKEVIDAKKKLLEGGFDFGPMAKLVQGMNFAKGMGWSSFEEKTGKWNQLLGLKGEESVEETVGRVVREGHPLVRG
jgi:hypothetical protein